MKNRVAYLILLTIIVFSAKAQNWTSVGSGITGLGVNTTWTLYSCDSILLAGGWFNNAGGKEANNLAQWNGADWDSLSSGCNGHINAFIVYDNNLYAGGSFSIIGGIPASNIARWNGFYWMPVGSGIRGGQYGVYSLAVYNGALYAGGSFDSAGSKLAYGIAQWNDTNWSAVSADISAGGEDDGVFALAVYDGELYLAGDFVVSGGSNIAKWNGATLSAVGLGTTGPVYSLAVYNDNLYAGGMMTMAGTLPVHSIAVWNNSVWAAIDSGITGENGYASVNALTVYNGELYAGGFFDTVNGMPVNCIARWDGTNWSPVSSGINVGGDIDAMAVFNNSLYVGGGFDSAGGIFAKNIAVWNTPSSVNEIKNNNKITVYPNPASATLSIKINNFTAGMFYTIYNELGQQTGTGKLNSKNTTAIDINSYIAGIYLLSVDDGNIKYYTKFVKN